MVDGIDDPLACYSPSVEVFHFPVVVFDRDAVALAVRLDSVTQLF